MKKWLIFITIALALGIGGFVYFNQQANQQNAGDKLIYKIRRLKIL